MREKVVTRIEPNVTIIPKLEPMARRKRVAAYARVSTASDEQMGSIDAQRDYYSKYIAGNTQWDFVGIYADEGISGTSSKRRPAFQQMIDDALAGKIDLILTKSLSRFARNTVDTLKTIRALKERNVEVYFEKEDIPGLFTYAALGSGTFSTLSVPSGLAVIRVRQPFWTISTTLRS